MNHYDLEYILQNKRKELEQVSREHWRIRSGEKKKTFFRNSLTRKAAIQNNQLCCT